VEVVVVAFTAAVITVEDSTVEDFIAAEDTDVAVVAAVIVAIAVIVVTDLLESLLYRKKPLRCQFVGVHYYSQKKIVTIRFFLIIEYMVLK
jgi:hypothetical protein